MTIIDQELDHEIARITCMSDAELTKAIEDYGQHPAVRLHQELMIEAARRHKSWTP